jgi:hypothetical protein
MSNRKAATESLADPWVRPYYATARTVADQLAANRGKLQAHPSEVEAIRRALVEAYREGERYARDCAAMERKAARSGEPSQ